MTTKLSSTQAAQLFKTASASIRTLSQENVTLRDENATLKSKVAAFEKRARVEAIATKMEEKSLNGHLSFEEKVAELMPKDNLDAVEEAVGMAAPQTKIASVVDGQEVEVESTGDKALDKATAELAAALASL